MWLIRDWDGGGGGGGERGRGAEEAGGGGGELMSCVISPFIKPSSLPRPVTSDVAYVARSSTNHGARLLSSLVSPSLFTSRQRGASGGGGGGEGTLRTKQRSALRYRYLTQIYIRKCAELRSCVKVEVGGRPGLAVSHYGLCGGKVTLNSQTRTLQP